MTSFLENQAGKAILNSIGCAGSQGFHVADTDYIVTSTNMVNSTYTIANQPKSACRISVTVTAVDTADTMGKITIVGTDYKGEALTEEVTPVAGSTVYTSGIFKTITSITGSGWVIDAVEGSNDTIVIGADYSQVISGYYIFAIQFIADSVVSTQTDKAGAINTQLTGLTSIPAGTVVYGKYSSISLTSGEAIGYLVRES